MKRLVAVLLPLGLAGCAVPLQRAERLYQQGDLLAALETWRAIPEPSPDYDEARSRVAEVENEFEQLAARYKQRAAYFEDKDRLAESILNYRLALELQPDDRPTLDLVQKLSRSLAERKRTHREAFEAAFRAQRLGRARREMTALRTLDPFDPDLSVREHSLAEALDAEVARRLALGRRGFFNGDYDTAEASFRKVLELEPENESAQGYLASIATMRDAERRSGRPPAAFRPPGFRASDAEIRAEGFYQNALAAERSGDPYAAIRYDLAAVASNPDHRGARKHMAALRLKLRPRVEELIESGRKAFGREDLHTALDRWRLALLIDPDNARARDYANRAEHLLANLERLRAEPQVSTGAP